MTSVPSRSREHPAPRRRLTRKTLLVIVGAVMGVALAVTLPLALSNSPPATMDGTLTVSQSTGTSTFCQGSAVTDPGEGAQVTVTSPSGAVIGTGSLGTPSTSTATLAGCSNSVEVYSFKVAGLPGEPRYGVTVASLSGTIWFTPAQLGHANLSLGP